MPIDFEGIRRRYETERLPDRRSPQSRPEGQVNDEALGFVDTAADILAAPFRGAAHAIQSTYRLGDALLLDALPDWEQKLFGESRTLVGGIVEGITQFATAFVPVYGWLGRAASAGRLLTSPVVRGAVAGAVADFAVFDGHEKRLSNLIQEIPALRNPITDFLAAEEDDNEAVGRLKNVLEGLGIGALTDGLILGVKALRAGRRAREAGQSADAVQKVMDAAGPPDQIDAALRATGDLTTPPPQPPPPSQPAASAVTTPPDPAASKVPTQAPPPEPSKEAAEAVLRTFDLDDDQVAAIMGRKRARTIRGQDPAVTPRKMSAVERAAQRMEETDLNLKHYRGPEGALQYIRAIEQVLEPLKGNAVIGRKTLNEQETEGLQQLADILGASGPEGPQRLLASMQRDVPDIAALNRRILAYKTAFVTYSNHVAELAKKLAIPSGSSDLARLEFKQALGTLAEMELGVKALLGEQGRGLGANRLQTVVLDDLALDRAGLQALLDDAGGAKALDDLAAKYAMVHARSGAPGTVHLARASLSQRVGGIFNEYWYNALLGRPTTLVVNALSGAFASVYRPLELMLGGALTANSEVVSQGFREILALAESVPEALKVAKAALDAGGNLLDPLHRVDDVGGASRNAITARTVGLSDESVTGQGVNWLGKLIRMPSKALMATDEFVKQVNYRAVAKATLAGDAAKAGLRGEDAARFVAERMDRLVVEGQAYGSAQLFNAGVRDAVEKGVKSKAAVHAHAKEFARRRMLDGEHARLTKIGTFALDRAQEVTFTKPLRPGTLSHKVQQAVRAHPLLRLVMPFVRTPVNLATFAAQRIDAPGAVRALAAKRFPAYASALESSKNRLIQDALSSDPARLADATGRFTAGMAVAAAVFLKAMESTPDGLPLITGFGPRDKEQRDILRQAGWEPYSIRVGNTYVSYARLDPFASLIGTFADATHFSKYAAEEDQETVETLSYGLAVALAHNFTNKTYLAGLANFMEALSDPQRQVPRLVRTFGGSLVPGQFAAALAVSDPVVRDVRSIMDAAASRIPGLADNVPAVRNLLGEEVKRATSLGDKVSGVFNAFVPIMYREVSDDVIFQELKDLEHGFTPPRRVRHGLDLSTVTNSAGRTAYDRWSELHGEVKIAGRSLRQELKRLIRSRAYQAIPAESTPEVQSPRIAMIRAVLDDYRQAAWQQTLREFPDLAALERQRVQHRRQLLAGRESRPNVLQRAGLTR